MTVDLSNSYLDWAEDNLDLNGLADARHTLVRADAKAWVEAQADAPERYDLVVCDPPSFSTSKKMEGELQRAARPLPPAGGHPSVLAPGGVLYFSTNFLGFELQPKATRGMKVVEITPRLHPRGLPAQGDPPLLAHGGLP